MRTASALTRRMLDWRALAGVMCVIPAVLGGCKSSGVDPNAVIAENQELRNRLAAESAARGDAEARLAALQEENRNLQSRRTGAGGSTGLEGIDGVRISRGAGGEVILDIAGEVLFDSGSATLKPGAKSVLDRVASVLNSRYGGNFISVEGHTDSDPISKSKWESNEHLSAARALAVEKYLTTKGVDNNRIRSVAYGPSNPKGSKPASRRVEIVILAGATQ